MKIRKAFSFILVLLMILNMSMFSIAETMDADYNIRLTSLNSDGGNIISANLVPDDSKKSYWAKLSDNDDINSLLIEIDNKNHPEYTYSPENNSVLNNVVDADGSFSKSVEIKVYSGENLVDTIYLYVSKKEMPEIESSNAPTFNGATLQVLYKTENGDVVASNNITLNQAGTNEVHADTNLLPEGYSLSDSSSKNVEVNQNGSVNPSEVVFTVSKSVNATLNISYVDNEGNILARDSQNFTEVGIHNVSYKEDLIPSGYHIVSEADVSVEVSHDSSVNPSEINFVLEKENKNVSATLYINYIDENGELLNSTSKEITKIGKNTIDVDYSLVPQNYELIGDSSKEIELYEDGNLSDATVEFKFKKQVAEETNTKEPIASEVPKDNESTASSLETNDNTIPEVEETKNNNISEYKNAVVNKDSVNIRKKVDGDIIKKLNSGTNVVVLEILKGKKDVEWAKIKYEGEKIAYIVASYLDIEGGSTPAPEETGEVLPEETKNSILASVRVEYKYNDEVLYSYNETFDSEGKHSISVRNVDQIAKYTLDDIDTKTVNVNSDSSVDHDYIYFNFKPLDFNAQVTLKYTDTNGNSIASDTIKTYSESGTYTLSPDINIDNYSLVEPKSYEIFISETGEASPSEVIFKYEHAKVEANLTVEYVDQDGRKIVEDTQVKINNIGINDIKPAVILTDYKIDGLDTYQVTLNKDGSLTPDKVTFKYKKIVNDTSAKLVVHYVDSEGSKIVEDTIQDIRTKGQNNIFPNSNIPEEYHLNGDSSQTVVMNEDGTLNPTEITFVYKKLPKVIAANVTISYLDSEYRALADSDNIVLSSVGKHPIDPIKKQFDGYVLRNKKEYVNVNEEGIAIPNEVVFVFDKILPKNPEAEIQILYVDENGTQISNSSVQKITTVGNNTIVANPSNIPSNYSLKGSNTVTVVLNNDGTVSQNPVIFVYKNKNDNFEHYKGYALANKNLALRTQPSTNDSSISTMLNRNTLLYITGQVQNNGILYHSVQTLDGKSGFVINDDITKISDTEAQKYREEYNNSLKPAPTPTAPPQTGYAMTLGANVPLRQFATGYSNILSFLPNSTVVYLNAQVEYADNNAWYVAQHNNQLGFLRSDQVRLLNQTEVNNYLKNNQFFTPNPNIGQANGYDANGLSSYGYVTADNVNFRTQPNKQSTVITKLQKYGLGLIKETLNINGVTWYKVNHDGREGYIQADFFKSMTLKEFNNFLNSDNYYKGIANNSKTNKTNSSTTSIKLPTVNKGSATPGKVQSLEDYNVTKWKNPNLAQASYEPFKPDITPMPSLGINVEITPSPTMIPLSTLEPFATSETEFNTNDPFADDTPVTEKTQSPSILPIILGIFGLGILGSAGYLFYENSRKQKMRALAKAKQAQMKNAANKDTFVSSSQNVANNVKREVSPNSMKEVNTKSVDSTFVQRKPINEDLFKKPSEINTTSSNTSVDNSKLNNTQTIKDESVENKPNVDNSVKRRR